MAEITHRFVATNGLNMHIAEAGSGPLVLFLHGFPDSWYSWRHQLEVLADAGYHAVAVDQRGVAQTKGPAEIDHYTQLHLVGDVIGLLDALDAPQAVIVGHDLGAMVAWNTALMRPDRVRGVVGLSVSYIPRGQMDFLTAMRTFVSERFFMAYFQEPGVAEAELSRDISHTLRTFFYSSSGSVPVGVVPDLWVVPEGQGLLDLMVTPETLPEWLSEADLAHYVDTFSASGFGMLNWFRNLTRDWELTAAWTNAPVLTPALFIVGERDTFLKYPGMQDLLKNLPYVVPNLKGSVTLADCGHWVHQERASEVNASLLTFLKELA